MKPLTIIFDRPYNTYFVGQTVKGRVEFTSSKTKKIKGIILQVKGEASVSWKGKEIVADHENGKNNKTEQVIYQGKEEYFRVEYYCMGSKENEGTSLPIGKHVYPFSFVLPINMPSSFEGKHGYIRYTIKIIIERPSKSNKETKTAFTVISPYVLNLNHSNLEEQVKVSGQKYFGWACFTSGPLDYIMTLPKSGFVPGENLTAVIEIDNKSNIPITEVILKLQQFTTYRSQKPSQTTKQEELLLEKIKLGELGKRISNTWRHSLVIPPAPPSNLQNCTIISTDYYLLLEIKVSYNILDSLSLSTPITIGTVPLINRRSSISKTAEPSAPPDYETAVASSSTDESNNIIPEIASSTLFSNKLYSTKSIRDYEDNENTKFCDNIKEFSPYYLVHNINSS